MTNYRIEALSPVIIYWRLLIGWKSGSIRFHPDVLALSLVSSIFYAFSWFGKRFGLLELLNAWVSIALHTYLLAKLQPAFKHTANELQSLDQSNYLRFKAAGRRWAMRYRFSTAFLPIEQIWQALLAGSAALFLLLLLETETTWITSLVALLSYVSGAVSHIPQLLLIRKTGSCRGFPFSVIIFWILNDIRMICSYERGSPFYASLCIYILTLSDLAIASQYWLLDWQNFADSSTNRNVFKY